MFFSCVDVRNYTMRFPRTSIPSNKTTYMCYNFVLPNDSTADIIAIEPVADNIRIVHHMLLFGCSAKPLGKDFTILFSVRDILYDPQHVEFT